MFRSMNSYASSLHLRVLAWPIRIPDAAIHCGFTILRVLWRLTYLQLKLQNQKWDGKVHWWNVSFYCFQGVSLDLVERKWEHIVVYSNYGNIIMSAFRHGPTRGSPSSMDRRYLGHFFYQASLCLPSSSGCRGSPSSMDGGWGGTVSFSWVDLNLNWLCECVWLYSISLVHSWWPCFFMGRFLPASRHGPTRGYRVR